MRLADIQKSINKATDTQQVLQTLDVMQLPVGTVLQHKHFDRVCTIQSKRVHYIDGVVYDVTDKNGKSWLVYGLNVNKFFNIINQPTEAKQ